MSKYTVVLGLLKSACIF